MTGPVVPAGGEELREVLAGALEERFGYAVSYATVIIDWDEEADALLPLIEKEGRRRAAEELTAAADEIDGDGLGGLSGAYRRMYSSDLLRARAAALAPENARPE